MAWYWWLLIVSGIGLFVLACCVSWVRDLLGLVFLVLKLLAEIFG